MALTTSTKRLPTPERGVEDRVGGRYYEVVFEVDQTDAGSRAAGVAVVIAAQTAGQLPLRGATYSYDGLTDLDSFLQEIEWLRPLPVDKERRWHVSCRYSPAEGINSGTIGENDPLLWPTEYWVDWVEEQIVLEEAKNVEALTTVGRAANTLGPIVNACGEETIEPLMKTIYYPVLNCQKCYATLNEIVALNLAYQGTTNNATFFGSPIRTAKYLTTESGRIQRVQGVEFYVGITRIWFKDATWDRGVLNNGWNHFKKDAAGTNILLDGASKPKLFANKVSDQTRAEAEANPDVDPEARSSEPLNLQLDGTLMPTDDDGIFINYRDLDEVNYAGIGIGS